MVSANQPGDKSVTKTPLCFFGAVLKVPSVAVGRCSLPLRSRVLVGVGVGVQGRVSSSVKSLANILTYHALFLRHRSIVSDLWIVILDLVRNDGWIRPHKFRTN